VADRADGARRVYRLAPDGFGDVQAYLNAFWEQALADLKAAAESEERGETR